MSAPHDVIIVGAGFAGLACARELKRAGLRVLVLEARARVGGRAHTVRDTSLPVELGAEFIHTADKSFLDYFREANLPFVDVVDDHFHLERGRLVRKKEFFDDIAKIVARFNPDRKNDRSVADFLEHSRVNPKFRPLFVQYIEGFHAADPAKISERGLAISEQPAKPELNGTEQFRPARGYGALLDKWVEEMGPTPDWLKLESVVQKIEWREGGVAVHGRPFGTVRARRAVVAVPLGVLKGANAHSQIKFDPVPPGLADALSGLEVGHVLRVTFEFTDRFWEDLHEEPVDFIHGPEGADFPVWWTRAPLRTNYLTAWQGGPRAPGLAALDDEAMIARALKTLSKISGRSVATLSKKIRSFHFHNWEADPYALGAYTYIATGGVDKARRLGRPFGNSLYFAGEATANGSDMATVHGAVRSGVRAARQILKDR